MVTRTLPSRALLQQLLNYDPLTGVFMWKPRPREMFRTARDCRAWNTKNAGKPAGSLADQGHIDIRLEGLAFKAHRLVWLHVYGEPVPERIDHKDRNRTNNRIGNLRAATHAQNLANTGLWKSNTTGFRGVSRKRNKFWARITVNRQHIHLGTFTTAEEAARAYNEAAFLYFGEFAHPR